MSHQIKIKHPIAPFANCFGSYFISCCNYFRPSMKEDMMLFLTSCHLKFFPLEYEHINQKFSGNPWGWKPLRICNSQGIPLFDEESVFRECITFMRTTLGVNADIISYEDQSITDAIVKCLAAGQLPIVFIDDFYNSHSEKYQTKHNPHGILVIDSNLDSRTFLVLDMDVQEEYQIHYDEVIRFIPTTYSNFLSDSFLALYTNEIPKKVDYRFYYEQYLRRENDHTQIQLFIQDMEKHLIECKKYMFFAKGHYFTIIYNIVPMALMRAHIIGKATHQSEIKDESMHIFNEWMRLAEFIVNHLEMPHAAERVVLEAKKILEKEMELDRRIVGDVKEEV